MVRLTLLPLILSAVPLGAQAFVGPRPSAFTQSTRLFEEEMPDPEKALLDNLGLKQNSISLDAEFIAFPSTEYAAPEVVMLCMDGLKKNNVPYGNAGLENCWNFSSDRCRAAQGGSLEAFIQFAANPIFSSMVDAAGWSAVSIGPLIEGTRTRGAMQTVLIDVTPAKGGADRRFLWTLQQERRPPRQGCWLVYECIDTAQAYQQTL